MVDSVAFWLYMWRRLYEIWGLNSQKGHPFAFWEMGMKVVYCFSWDLKVVCGLHPKAARFVCVISPTSAKAGECHEAVIYICQMPGVGGRLLGCEVWWLAPACRLANSSDWGCWGWGCWGGERMHLFPSSVTSHPA